MNHSEKELYEKIGRAIKETRKQFGYTMQDLAQRIDLSQSAISMIENGIRHPSMQTLTKLSQVLGVDFRKMLFDSNPKEFPLQTPLDQSTRAEPTGRSVPKAFEIKASDFSAHLQIAKFECTIDEPDFHQPIYEALSKYIAQKLSDENIINELNALMKSVKKDIVLKKEEELIRLRRRLLDE